MSFLHVLGDIGKNALGIAAKVGPHLPGPIGTLVGIGLSVANAEVNGGSGETKKAEVVGEAVKLVPDHPDKLQLINQILEGIVAIMNALSKLYPPDKPNA